jgi:protein TonB
VQTLTDSVNRYGIRVPIQRRSIMKFFLLPALCLVWLLAVSPVKGERAGQEKAAPQTSDPPRVAVKGEAMKKMLVHKVNPSYPPSAMNRRIAGTVKLHVVIGVDGGVKQADYISGPSVLVQPTIDAVRKWKYKPPTASGQPVEVDTTVEVVFSLVQ